MSQIFGHIVGMLYFCGAFESDRVDVLPFPPQGGAKIEILLTTSRLIYNTGFRVEVQPRRLSLFFAP